MDLKVIDTPTINVQFTCNKLIFLVQTDPTKWTSRFCNWGEYKCHGTFIRGICVFGIGDLPLLASRHELIANKFYLKVDPIAYQCFEELLVNRSKLELPLANAQIYRQMSFLSSP